MILTVRFGIWIRVVDLDRCTAEGAWVANTIIGPEDDRASTLGSFGRVDADLPGEWYCSEEQLRRRLVSVSWSNDESKWRSWYGPCLLAEPDGRKYWWAQNTWGSEWGLVGYFKMARGSDDSAFESMAVAIDVDGALPMMLEQPRSGDDVDEDVFLSGEGRRQAALQRRSRRRQNAHVALTPEHAPPPTPSPRFARIEEPREHFGPWAGGSDAAGAGAHHHSMLDSLAHWLYGG